MAIDGKLDASELHAKGLAQIKIALRYYEEADYDMAEHELALAISTIFAIKRELTGEADTVDAILDELSIGQKGAARFRAEIAASECES